jgi:hypothetical protein
VQIQDYNPNTCSHSRLLADFIPIAANHVVPKCRSCMFMEWRRMSSLAIYCSRIKLVYYEMSNYHYLSHHFKEIEVLEAVVDVKASLLQPQPRTNQP